MSMACAIFSQPYPDVAARINEPLFDFKQMAVHAAHRQPCDARPAARARGRHQRQEHLGAWAASASWKTPRRSRRAPLIARGAEVDIWAAANLGMADRVQEPARRRSGAGQRQGRRRQAAAALCAHRSRLRNSCSTAARRSTRSMMITARRRSQYLVGDNARGVPISCVARGAALGFAARPRAWRSRTRAPASRRQIRRHPDAGEPGLVSDDRHRHERRAHLPVDARVSRLGIRCRAQAGPQGGARSSAVRAPVRSIACSMRCGMATATPRMPCWRRTRPLIAGSARQRHAAGGRRRPEQQDGGRQSHACARLSGDGCCRSTARRRCTGPHFTAIRKCWQAVLNYDPPLEMRDRDFNGTAMGWVIQGALNHWHGISTAKHDECARLLLDAGAQVDETALPTGHEALDRVLRAHFLKA